MTNPEVIPYAAVEAANVEIHTWDTMWPTDGQVARALAAASPLMGGVGVAGLTEAQVKHMVGRFLTWKLPENFSPDGGISFKKTYNDHRAHPRKNEPVGTNLLGAVQAAEMIRYLVVGLPVDDPDEAYELGKRDGYEDAIQDIDIATGGDGEFKGSTFPGETIDVPAMKARIIERFKAALLPTGKAEGSAEALDWQFAAFDETVALARSKGMAGVGDLSLDHLVNMQSRLTPDMSRAKVGRWLGWAQAALYANGVATLDDVKHINMRCSAAAVVLTSMDRRA